MRISVAMAVRDSERYLRELLHSLAGQTEEPCELVVYDDASGDSTLDLLAEFARDARFPVRVFGGVHRGHAEAFLHAAARCSGEAIAFCDADDVWEERKLEVCARALESSNAVLAMHTTRVVDRDLRDRGVLWPRIDKDRDVPPLGWTSLEQDAPGMAMVFRSHLLEVVGPERRPPSRYDAGHPMLHDEWTLFLAGAVGTIRLIAEPLVRYRQHEANASGGWVDRRRRLTIRPAVEDYRNIAEHTAACARFLEQAGKDSPDMAGALEPASRHYRQVADAWMLRISLYDAADRRSRARLLRRLLAAGAYRSRAAGGLGKAALGKDVAAGLGLRLAAR